LINLKL